MISALDGPIAVTECIDDVPGECSQEDVCRLRGNWQRINHAVRQALESITLAELTALHLQGALGQHPPDGGRLRRLAWQASKQAIRSRPHRLDLERPAAAPGRHAGRRRV